MRKLESIARQSAHPRGLLGHVVGRVMALDTARVNQRVVQLLEPKPGERILELGCGHGRTVRRIANHIGEGHVLGVDPSGVMRSIASQTNRDLIAAGRVRIERGHSGSIPAGKHGCDKALSVHTLYFWPDFDAGFRELARVLRPGGQLLLAFHSQEETQVAAKLPSHIYTLPGVCEVERALRIAGFRDVEIGRDGPAALQIARATV